MRTILATTSALLLTLPTPLLAQHHGGGGGGGGHMGGGAPHMGGGGGGGGGAHFGGGGGAHFGGGGAHFGGGGAHFGGASPHFGGGGTPHFSGGGARFGGGGAHFGGTPRFGGGDRIRTTTGGLDGGGRHFGAEHRNGVTPIPGGLARQGGSWHGGASRPSYVINNSNRTVIRNEGFRGGNGYRSNFAGGGGFGRHGLPPGPPRGGWHQGWYGGHVGGFRPIHAGYYRYPRGWSYRRWGIGLVLPAILFGSAYYYYNWPSLGAYAPPPGDRWVRYGPDLLLINIASGRVDDAIYGAFY